MDGNAGPGEPVRCWLMKLFKSPQAITPPLMAEKLLLLLLDPEDEEPIRGDFAEEFYRRAEQGPKVAQRWYWHQVARSAPALGRLKFYRWCERRRLMIEKSSLRQAWWAIRLGILGLVPGLLIALPGLIRSLLGISGPNDALYTFLGQLPWLQLLIHPLVILGGVLLALGLNVRPVLHLSWQGQIGALSGTLTFKGWLLHWALI